MDLISTLNEDDIMNLEFVETPGTDTQAAILKPVIKYQLSLLTAFLDFVDYTQTTQANFTTLKECMSITMDQFTEYRTSSHCHSTHRACPYPPELTR
jgi:hypothetical protein